MESTQGFHQGKNSGKSFLPPALTSVFFNQPRKRTPYRVSLLYMPSPDPVFTALTIVVLALVTAMLARFRIKS